MRWWAWPLFSLLGRARTQAQAGVTDRCTLTFQLGEPQAAFDVRIQGAGNSSAEGVLPDFRCPSVRVNRYWAGPLFERLLAPNRVERSEHALTGARRCVYVVAPAV